MKLLKELWKKIKWRWKLKEMDDMWYLMGGGGFGGHPPSFCYKHTPEEVKRIHEEELAELRRLIKEFEESI